MWQKVAGELGIPWRSAESMHWQLGQQEMVARANAPVFQMYPLNRAKTSISAGTLGQESTKRRRSSPGKVECEHELKFGRASISPTAQEILEDHFKRDPYPDQKNVDMLSAATALSAKQVRTWYANARSRKTGASGKCTSYVTPSTKARPLLVLPGPQESC
jgi:hypothetical protein